jgi:transcriptional regulator with XRE-family HTH domain
MAANIALLLDKAKVIHRLSSDYKLALVMGVKLTTLSNYRAGKTLPDARVIRLICDLTGDDPALMAAEVEEQRAKTDEARNLWHMVAQRLQAGAAAAIFSVLFVLGFGAGLPMESHASAPTFQNFSSYTSWNFPAMLRRWCSPLVWYFRALLSGFTHVPRTSSTAPA